MKNDTSNLEQQIAINASDSTEMTDTLENKGKITMGEILEAFIYCKETAENSLQCKYFIAKAINDYFRINDFSVNGSYVDYDKIAFIVKSSDKWKNLGLATSQSVLNTANDLANVGRPVIAIQTSSTLGHVVIVLPGLNEKAMSWGGLSVPKCASFFMIDGVESFVDKSMAFAWETPNGIEIFARNK